MTGLDVPGGLGVPGEPRRRVTGRPRAWAFATHKPCPVDGCPGPAGVPPRSAAHPAAPAHRDSDHGPDHDPDTVPCRRCGTGPRVPAEW
ncbi:hypothetical protein [Streptomyces sp. NPDC048277]|uniref:hypothetical protein n=1 Tax=Streptomyces sp. NPDC048277 TaxID=3155027 RepID=UPI0033CC6577